MYSRVLHVDCTDDETKRAEFILKWINKSQTEILQYAVTFFDQMKCTQMFVTRNYIITYNSICKNWAGSKACGGKCQTLPVCPQAQQLVTKNTPVTGNYLWKL